MARADAGSSACARQRQASSKGGSARARAWIGGTCASSFMLLLLGIEGTLVLPSTCQFTFPKKTLGLTLR